MTETELDKFSEALGVNPQMVKASLALILIAVVYQINPKAGWVLGILAIIAILTR